MSTVGLVSTVVSPLVLLALPSVTFSAGVVVVLVVGCVELSTTGADVLFYSDFVVLST